MNKTFLTFGIACLMALGMGLDANAKSIVQKLICINLLNDNPADRLTVGNAVEVYRALNRGKEPPTAKSLFDKTDTVFFTSKSPWQKPGGQPMNLIVYLTKQVVDNKPVYYYGTYEEPYSSPFGQKYLNGVFLPEPNERQEVKWFGRYLELSGSRGDSGHGRKARLVIDLEKLSGTYSYTDADGWPLPYGMGSMNDIPIELVR